MSEVSFTAARVSPFNPSGAPVSAGMRRGEVALVLSLLRAGQKRDGPEKGATFVVDDGFEKLVRSLGWAPSRVVLHQTAPSSIPRVLVPPGHKPFKIHRAAEVAIANHDLYRICSSAHRRGLFPVNVGADHAFVLGSIRASCEHYPDLCVVWVDAHADMNTPFTSPSGNIHGMPVAFLCGLDGTEYWPDLHAFKCVELKQIGFVGLRDLDDGEIVVIKKHIPRQAKFMVDIQRDGFESSIDDLLKILDPSGTRPIHLSIDVDGMDPFDAPSTGTPVDRGVRLHETLSLVRRLRDSGRLVAADVMEVNPMVGSDRDAALTRANVQWVIAELLGRRAHRIAHV